MHPSPLTNCTATAPILSSAACRQLLRAVWKLRAQLQVRFQQAFPQGGEVIRLKLAEAETLAWETSFPHLVLPLLAEEKVSLALANRRSQHDLAA